MLHYMQIYRVGHILESTRRYHCLVKGCNSPHCARGYCQAHYRQLVRTGKIKTPVHPEKQTCAITNCNKKKFSRSLCHSHYDYYLYHCVHKGKTWEDIDQIIADLNQNFLAHRSRLATIKSRWEIIQNAKEAYFRKQAIRDQLEDTLLGSDELETVVESRDLDDLDPSLDKIREEEEDEFKIG